ncbi:MAG: hypothetical protein OJF55_001383 [Rhodanobacteraceae bacterium]|nr:MAG: hypothetical protein OJF55_001383 [Rhodanobacteraceae bacterium]
MNPLAAPERQNLLVIPGSGWSFRGRRGFIAAEPGIGFHKE